MHEAALGHGVAMRTACATRAAFLAVIDAASSEGFQAEIRSAGMQDVPPFVLDPQAIDKFIFDCEKAHDAELARQAAPSG
jgi:hypothetical protein